MPVEAVLVAVLVLVVLPLVWLIATYNRLVRVRNHIRESWSNVDTELKRRYDLIPNLVSTVKGYAEHERQVLEEVTRLRELAAADTGTPMHQADTENQLVRALNRLLVRIEAYPDLKASRGFLELQRELANTEDRIQAARRFYNGNVRENNNLVQSFPSSLVAGMSGFGTQEYFEVESASVRSAPEVSLGA